MNEELKKIGWDIHKLANQRDREEISQSYFRNKVRDSVDLYATNKAANTFFMGVVIGSLLTTLITLILI